MKVNDLVEAAIKSNGKNASIRKVGGSRDLWRGDLRQVGKKYINCNVFELAYINDNREIVIYIK